MTQSPEIKNISDLIRYCEAGYRAKYLFFWGHQPPHDGSLNQACLSQWFFAPFIADQITYPTAEHYMMAAKARLFRDEITLSKILVTQHPHEAKQLGRMVQNFQQEIWQQYCCEIVVRGNYFKFAQQPQLREFLVNTKPRVLVEASPADRIWGVGLDVNHPAINQPQHWQGLNLLGFALMATRQHLVMGTEPEALPF